MSETQIRSVDGRDVVWEAQPRQDIALRCPADELCYGGTKGGGKTDYLVVAPWEQIALCDRKWRATGRKQRGRAVCFRKNVDNLSDLIQRSKEIYPVLDPAMGAGGWNKVERRWTFGSGYTVDFRHLDGPNDHEGYNGQEITALLFDQVEEIEEHVYQFLRMQVRSKDADMRKLLIVRCTANPGGRHAGWVKSYFYEGCKPHNTLIREAVKLSRGRTKEITKAFVPAKLADNRYLDSDGAYEANLQKLPAHMREMYLEGNWDVVVGAYFSHVLRSDVHFIPSFPISGAWPVKMGIDWGAVAPACALFGARDNDGTVYIIDELYTPGITGRTFGEKLHKKFQLQRWSADRRYSLDEVYGLLDYSARVSQGGDGGFATPAAGIASWGFRLFDANKDRAAGNDQTLERLLIRPNGKPMLYVFKDRCPNLVRTLPLLVADPKNPNDVDTDGEDHAYDALKYLLNDWPVDTVAATAKGEDKDVERWMALARARKTAADGNDERISTGYGD